MLIMIGYIIIAVIVILYYITVILLYVRQNPKYVDRGIQSTVTHTRIGKRGDMGNQIFQIACLIAAGNRSNSNIVLPSHVEDLPISKLFDLSHIPKEDLIPDASFYEYDNYELIVIPKDGRIYDICGYRQAYKYFDDYSEIIRKVFTPRADILDKVKEMLPDRYIAVHIRRGDYIKLMHKIPFMKEFKKCQLNYYKEGIKHLRNKYPDLPLLVCTDDPKWAKTILDELYVNCKLAPLVDNISPKFSDYCTLYLADGVVISNSTFSWMAAYLNNNNNMVICPSPWWDPSGFIGSAMGLNGPYLHYPSWILLDPDNGKLVRNPYSNKGELFDTNHQTLSIFKLARGLYM